MEFTEVFTGLAIILVMIVSVVGMTSFWNDAYGSEIGAEQEFSNTIDRVDNLLTTSFVEEGINYAGSTQPEAGASTSSDQQDNMISRALRTIGLIDDLIGLVPALIKDAGAALNISEVFVNIAVALYWIIFSVTLALLLLIGARSIL